MNSSQDRSPPKNRTDMTLRTGETWRPVTFTAPGRHPLLDRLRRFLDLQAGSIWHDLAGQLPHVRGEMLDVGCGAQPYRPLLGPSAHYRGIDIADAKANFGYDVPDTTYFRGDVWPVENRSIDFLLCTETLEHVPDPRKLLAEAARCIKPGGTIMLTVPFSARWHYIPHDYWRYSPTCLKMLLAETGFTDISVYARGNAMTVSCYKTMALVLPVVMPQGHPPFVTWMLRLLSIVLLPYLGILAAIGNLSLMGRGGDDCLGYTALARRAADSAVSEPTP